MDIKAKIEELVEKVKSDKGFGEEFKQDPVKAVENALGVDIPDGVTDKIVDGVKAKLGADKLGDIAGKLKGIF